MSENRITINAILENEVARKFTKIKEHYGLENNTEIFRLLIFDKYQELFPKERKGV